MRTPADTVWRRAHTVEVRGLGADSVAVVSDAGELAQLAGLLEVDFQADAFVCMCWGDVRFLVKDVAGQTIADLTLHAESGLDWDEWGGQFPLLRGKELTHWLTKRGLCSG
ncbi:hypothetical protein [Streptomyces sp. NPDC002994]|uniref:hypothetical protein n=1 Tax=Streptomyces sp. NPDC002994 TaxID=3154441 RepID=UPI0033B79FCB